VNRQFNPDAWADYLFWFETDHKVLRKINELIRDATRTPFSGLGKPEPLKNELAGCWSRRISDEHRMIYRVVGKGEEQILEIVQLRHHYKK
jgi:toxin YoeB